MTDKTDKYDLQRPSRLQAGSFGAFLWATRCTQGQQYKFVELWRLLLWQQTCALSGCLQLSPPSSLPMLSWRAASVPA